MGYYNVLKPCVVGKSHYITVPAQPIEVDDEVAGPLAEAGSLAPYRPGGIPGKTGTVIDGLVRVVPDPSGEFVVDDHPDNAADPEPTVEEPPRRSRSRKSSAES